MMIYKFYAALLRLYPRRFREEFGDEMQSVFEDATKMQSGQWSSLLLLLHELHDLPGSLFKAYAAERPQGWETTMKKRIIYFIGIVVLSLGVWLSVSMYLGLLNPGTFIALAIAVVLIAFPISPIIRRVSYKIWVSIGLFTLVVLFFPLSEFTKILIISLTLVIVALLANSIFRVNKERRDSNAGEANGIHEQLKKPDITAIFILALIVLLLVKASYSFYWFMIWDSTTDSLDWLWLPIPVLAVIFSSFILYFLLPDRTKSKGFLYLIMIPTLIGVYNLAKQVDFRQLTNQRAEYVSQLVEKYYSRVGHYPKDLRELTPRFALTIPAPVIISGQDWCYDSGEDYYRLGYITRKHWSDPRLIGKIHKVKGDVPNLPGMCEAEVIALRERYPDYPYEYWSDGELE